MPVACAFSLDNLRTVPKALLTESITRLGAERMDEICRALIRAAGCLLHRRSVAFPIAGLYGNRAKRIASPLSCRKSNAAVTGCRDPWLAHAWSGSPSVDAVVGAGCSLVPDIRVAPRAMPDRSVGDVQPVVCGGYRGRGR